MFNTIMKNITLKKLRRRLARGEMGDVDVFQQAPGWHLGEGCLTSPGTQAKFPATFLVGHMAQVTLMAHDNTKTTGDKFIKQEKGKLLPTRFKLKRHRKIFR